jgi:hypothetical protein
MPPTVKSDLGNASVEKNKCSQYACNSLQAETPQQIAAVSRSLPAGISDSK